MISVGPVYSILVLLGFFVRGATAIPDDGAIQVAGTNDKCGQYCDATYPKQDDIWKACGQGCRLFTILQLSGDDNTTTVRDRCSSACSEAFPNSDKRSACANGCGNQTPFTNGRVEIVMDSSSPLFKYAGNMFGGVFDKMEEMQKNVMDNFRSWFDWPKQNNEDVFQSMDREMNRMQEQMNRFMGDLLAPADANKPYQPPNGGHKPIRTGKEFGGKMVGNTDDQGQQILSVNMIVPSEIDSFDRTNTLDSLDQKANEPSPPLDPSLAVDPDDSWLACLAQRARRLNSVTRWLVCLALFLCVVAMIWICLAIIRTAPRRRLLYARAEEVKIAGLPIPEKKFLVETMTQPPDSPPPPYSAEPLPVKIAEV